MQKKRFIVTIIVLAMAALTACGRATTPEPEPTEEPLPEPGTIILDKEKNITATVGVVEADETWEEEAEPTPTPTPWPSATPEPSASPSPSASPEPSSEPSPAPSVSPSVAPQQPAKCSYEVFYALSPEQKDAFLNSFESYRAFYEWLIAAQEEFKQLHPDMEIGPGGVIDLSQLQK